MTNTEPLLLPNGLRLLLDEMPGARSCAVNLCVLSGPRYERLELGGISHMMEHMLFKGTQERTARELAEAADDLGANLNAYTCKEYTCFYIRTLPEHLFAMLELLADMIFCSRLAQEELQTEKGVVAEEIAMYEDSPEDRVFDLFYEMIWPGHMLGKNILGTRKTLEAMTAEDLRAHARQFYTPGRMVLSICGIFDAPQVRARAEELFGRGTGDAAPFDRGEPAVYTPGISFHPKSIEQNQIVLGFPGCALNAPQRYQAALLSTMLGGSTSSRLFQRLREELGLVYSVEYFNVHHCREGISGISMGLSAKEQIGALAEALKVLRAFPDEVTAGELRRAQEQAAAGLVMSLESNAARASCAASNVLLLGKDIPAQESIAAYRAVTLDEIRAYARDIMDQKKFSLCVLGKCGKKAQRELKGLLEG
ncbi:MAG: insulinase family protein [Oscillospiraceae bacterium]|jgi:predicted Zn-dependent peptidase|nr:insulinase family protein [Oscillospiraceae bacterium]